MNTKQIIECVPNFSEGRDMNILKSIADAIRSVEGVKLLDVDPGKATNRTVMTFVGEPASVIEGAFQAIKRASELIDMSRHSGEHPRMGATDVCPLIPIANISMDEVVEWAHKLGKRVGDELGVTGYYYENAATKSERTNLAVVRAGEYEGLPKKVTDSEWKPDFGPATFNPSSGASAIGARDFLIAYNVNLNTTSVRRANSVAFDIREKGRIKRTGNPVTGPVVRNENGDPVRVPGSCKSVKAIGWYIEEYGLAQISMNLTNIHDTTLHEAFEACRKSANERGLRVTGSELVGLVPKQVMLDAGRYFLHAQDRSTGLPDEELIRIAIKSLSLNELSEFDYKKKIIEYRMQGENERPLIQMSLAEFANETASESVAPGGGSIAAYVGALAAALTAMVANLSAHKRGWDDRWRYFSDWAEKGQHLQNRLQELVDEDTAAFNAIIAAVRMPKGSESEKKQRLTAMVNATKGAVEVPFQVMQTAFRVFDVAEAMIKEGNPNSISDAGVAALCARAAIHGAHMNVVTNCQDIEDGEFTSKYVEESNTLAEEADTREKQLVALVHKSWE